MRPLGHRTVVVGKHLFEELSALLAFDGIQSIALELPERAEQTSIDVYQ